MTRPEQPPSAERLSQTEQAILEGAAQYGNMPFERAQMEPELGDVWRKFRADGLFMSKVYDAAHNDVAGAHFDKKKIKYLKAPDITFDSVEGLSGRSSQELVIEKERLGITESVSFRSQSEVEVR